MERLQDRHWEPFTPLALGTWAGACLAVSAHWPEPAEPVLWLLVLVAAALVGSIRRGRPRRLAAALVASGAALGAARGLAVRPPDGRWPAGPVRVYGTVARTFLPVAAPQERRGDALHLVEATIADRPAGRVTLLLPPGVAAFPAGTVIEARGRLRATRRVRRLGSAWRPRSMPAVVRVPDRRLVRALSPPAAAPRAWIESLRLKIARRLRERLPPDAAGLAVALVLGERNGLGEETWRAFRRSGCAHLLAISGFHVAVVVLALRRVIGVFLPPRAADAGAVVGASLVALLGGAGTPVLRAALATGMGFAPRLFGRRLASSRAGLSLALLFLVTHDPQEALSPSLQLTFAAAYALVGAFDRPAGGGRLLRAWKGSVVASGATAPLVAFHFGGVAWAGPVLQLLVAPLFLAAYGAALSLALLLAAPIDPPEALSTWTGRILQTLLGALGWAAGEPRLVAWPPRPDFPAAALLVLAFCSWQTSGDSARARGVTALLSLSLLLSGPSRPAPSESGLLLIDVGHGQAALLRTESGAAALFDAGSRARPEIAFRRILNALEAARAPRLDVLVVSHSDADHAGAAALLAQSGRVRRVLLPSAEAASLGPLLRACGRADVPVSFVARGDRLPLPGGGDLLFLWPPPTASRLPDNDRSAVVRVKLRAGPVVLLPGDVEDAALGRLLRSEGPSLLACDVLLLPHHGQPCDRLFGLLRTTGPSIVAASRSGPLPPATRSILARSGRTCRTTFEEGDLWLPLRSGDRRSSP